MMKVKKMMMNRMGMAVCLAAAAAAVSAAAGGKKNPVPTEDPPEGALHPLLAKTIEAGPYRARWRSLVTHTAPAWYTRDRVGLTAHWGLYSVPGWTERKDTPYGVAYAEWYWQWMKQFPAVKAHHREHYGDAGYDAFIDGVTDLKTGEKAAFRAEKFNADDWMRLFKKAGVKYFVLTSKHHDGYCLFNTAVTDRNSVKTGPRRDLCGEVVAAARRHGLKVGFYYSFYEWHNPHYTGKGDIKDYKGCTPLKDVDGDGKLEYVDDYMIPQIKELIDQYHPDYLCFDGEWEHGYVWWRGREILAYFYNQAAARGQEVVANDRYGQSREGCTDTRGVYGDFKHVEYYANVDKSQPWAMWRGFGNSYGYNANEDPKNILSRDAVVRMIVDCAATGGNTEFNIGPKADGTLAEWDADRLEGMGEWLAVNGASIYGTEASPFRKPFAWGRCTRRSVPGGARLYLHVFDWPEGGRLFLPGLRGGVDGARSLKDRSAGVVTRSDRGVSVAFPSRRPGRPEMPEVIEVRVSGPLDIGPFVPTLDPSAKPAALDVGDADTTGGIRLETAGGKQNIGFWESPRDTVSWTFRVARAGSYRLGSPAAALKESAFEILADGAVKARVSVPATGDYKKYRPLEFGTFAFPAGRDIRLTFRPVAGKWAPVNLRNIVVEKAE